MTGSVPTFRAVIELWDTREALATDISAKSSAVSKWWQRDNIPPEWWEAILATGRARTAGLSAKTLTQIAARPRDAVRSCAAVS